jgi:nitrite reductase/ring-hydroxylating ferredoxin subunit
MNITTGTVTKFFFVSLYIVLFCTGCDKEKNRIIPYVPVRFEVNLNIVNELTVPGNSVYFSGPGYAGVIVYCEMQGIYHAYDAACTHEILSSCVVKNEGVLGTCPCCGSQYVLMGGAYPAKGPASFPLQPYHVTVMGNIVRVYN